MVQKVHKEFFYFQLETKFKGIQYAPAMATSEDLFKCRVKFEGSNVIEGMRELGEAGIAEVPMPKHLRGLSNLGQNFIVLRDRKPLLPSQTSNLSWPFNLLHTEKLFQYIFIFLRQSLRTLRIWRTKKETCFIVNFSFHKKSNKWLSYAF